MDKYFENKRRFDNNRFFGGNRDKVLERDNWTCQDCGIREIRLDVHHIIPFLKSFDNSLNNLISLCRQCHGKWERRICNVTKSS